MKYIDTDHLIHDILPLVSKPARYMGRELNRVMKGAEEVSLRVVLAFPEIYEIGMSYLGFGILYHILNKETDIWAERVFAPWPDMEERLREKKMPLYSLESYTPLSEFDIVGFTLQYELTYTNILNMLDLGGIEVFSVDRRKDDPIVIAGGPCACNPEPMADFFDVVFIGDGEEGFPEVCRRIGEGRRAGLSRRDILWSLHDIAGVYLPSFYDVQYDDEGDVFSVTPAADRIPEVIRARKVSELKPDFYPQRPVLPLIDITHNRLSVEVMRGCTQGCRYCNAGMIYRPVRERSPQEITTQTAQTLPGTGYEEVSFLSLSVSDYSELPALLKAEHDLLNELQVNYSFPSMRLDSFTEEIADYASNVRKSGITFAPESGSPRLRDVINKNISDDDLFNAIEIALRKGWRLLKFYFMIGLPTETKEDIDALADLMKAVVEKSRQWGNVRFNVSVSAFSPKAHTPFQWEAQNSKTELEEKIDRLNKRLARIRQIHLSWRDPDVSYLECVLGRGDRRTAQAVYHAWKSGARFDGWSDYFDITMWERAFEKAGLHMERYAEACPTGKPLPWDHIDYGVKKSFLLKERRKAYQAKRTADCRDGTCYGCGVKRSPEKEEKIICHQLTDRAEHMLIKPPSMADEKTGDAHPPLRVRLQYKKTGFSRFLSHLDLIRLFYRAFRSARLPVGFSQGFHPKPKISFSAPLPLGYTSDAEFMDVEINTPSAEDVKDRLNTHLPEGIEITESRLITKKVDSLTAAIGEFLFELDLSGFPVDENVFRNSLNEILSRETIPVKRTVKGKEKDVDIRPYIDSLECSNGSLFIRTKTIESRSVRIQEILEQLFPSSGTLLKTIPVCRKAQKIRIQGSAKNPMDIVS